MFTKVSFVFETSEIEVMLVLKLRLCELSKYCRCNFFGFVLQINQQTASKDKQHKLLCVKQMYVSFNFF